MPWQLKKHEDPPIEALKAVFDPASEGEARPLLTSAHPPQPPPKGGDGLLTRANEAVGARAAMKHHAKELHFLTGRTCLCLAYALTLFGSFLLSELVVYRLYHKVWLGVAAYAFAITAAVLAVLYLPVRLAGSSLLAQRTRWALRFILTGTWLGLILGFELYYVYFITHFTYEDLQRHTDVMASAPAQNYKDMGSVQFSSSTQIDSTRGVGFRDAELGVTLCVAPILDSTMTNEDNVSFFAVGQDCCDWRASFMCATEEPAHYPGGLVDLKLEQYRTRPWIQQIFRLSRTKPSHERYVPAIRMSSKLYDYQPADEFLLVHWTFYPLDMLHDIWQTGFDAAMLQVVAVAQVALIAGICVVAGPEQLKQWESRPARADGRSARADDRFARA